MKWKSPDNFNKLLHPLFQFGENMAEMVKKQLEEKSRENIWEQKLLPVTTGP